MKSARVWIMRGFAVLLAIGCIDDSHAQTADVAVTIASSKTSRIALGDEILVSVTVRNNGPGGATEVFLGAEQTSNEEYFFYVVESLNPACGPVLLFDIDPPLNGFYWRLASLAAGAEITCTARLNVSFLPFDFGSTLFAGVHTFPFNDPVVANNQASVTLSFLSPRQPSLVPAVSITGGLAIALALLATGVWRSLADERPR